MTEQRRAYRRRDVVRLFGASMRSVDKAIASGEIRTNKRGHSVFLHPGDVERAFGFREAGEAIEISTESRAEMAEFIKRLNA